MATTVREIAAAARVSIGTVSRALRYAPGVSLDQAAKVRAIATKLRYEPSNGRAIRRVGTPARVGPAFRAAQPLHGRAVAMLVLGIEQSLTSLPVIANALQGVEAGVSQAGGALIFADCRDVDRIPPALETQSLAGVILNGALEGDTLAREGRKLLARLSDLPAVWLLGRPLGIDWGDTVGTDNPAVGALAAQFFLSRGHRHAAFVSSVVHHPLVDQRQASFEMTMRRAAADTKIDIVTNQRVERTLLPERRTTIAEAEELTDRFLALAPRPTAIFAPFDTMGSMVQQCLQRRGVRVGEDVQIISCNNERPLIESLIPPLPTIDIDAPGIGRKAAELLAWRLSRPRDEQTVTWSLKPRLTLPE
jgi:DNA-binding LacI/PurR family transcriptional regulator